MINLIAEFMWSTAPIPIEEVIKNPEFRIQVPFGAIMPIQAPVLVESVNGLGGHVWLGPSEVQADPAGSSKAVQDNLDVAIPILNARIDAQIANLSQIMADKDLILSDGVEANRLEILKRASVAMVEQLGQALLSYAEKSYVDQKVADLVGQDQQILATIQELSTALNESEGLIEALELTTANRVRFDVATQALTSLQKYNARTNIGAEEIGTARMLIDAITPASIGAATKSQGDLATSALQSSDVAVVGLSGQFKDLMAQDKMYDVAISNWVAGTNTPVADLDSLRTILAKFQGQISARSTEPVWRRAADVGTVHSNIEPSATIGSDVVYLEFAIIGGLLWVRGAFSTKTTAFSASSPDYVTPNFVTLNAAFKCTFLSRGTVFNSLSTPVNIWFPDGTSSGASSRLCLWSDRVCTTVAQSATAVQGLVMSNNITANTPVRIYPTCLGAIVK